MSNSTIPDQSQSWSKAAGRYEEEFIDPDRPGVKNPLRPALTRLAAVGVKRIADLGCGTGPLLPFLVEHFAEVFAVDFAPGMLERARERCRGVGNVHYLHRPLREFASANVRVDAAIAINSLIMPDMEELEASLASIHESLNPGGHFLGIVPAIDSVHYMTMLMLDRARERGMPSSAARKNAAVNAEHELFDFAFGEFRYRGLVQHFWQPFEVSYRLRRAGFQHVRLRKVSLTWDQVSRIPDLTRFPPPWDWFFEAEKPVSRDAESSERSAV